MVDVVEERQLSERSRMRRSGKRYTEKPFSADEYVYLCALLDDDLKDNEKYTTAEWQWRHNLKGKIHNLTEMQHED